VTTPSTRARSIWSRRLRRKARIVLSRARTALGGRHATHQASAALRAAGSLLPSAGNRTVVLLAHDAGHGEVDRWLRLLAGHDLHVLSGKADPRWDRAGVAFRHHAAPSLHLAQPSLELLGRVTVVVDLRSRTAEQLDRAWHNVAFHLDVGGAYLRPSPAQAFSDERELHSWIARRATDPAAEPTPIILTPDVLMIVKRHRHYLKLRPGDTQRILPSREPELVLHELAELPAGELVSRARVVSHGSEAAIPWLSSRMKYPPLRVRHYAGRIGFLGSTLLHSDTSILVDSFRDQPGPDPAHRLLDNDSARFARIPPALTPERTLDGHFYHLDTQFGGHFGHVMTELVGRLWGWDEAKRQLPELKAIFHARRRPGADALERRLLRAYGIADDDIVQVDRPVYLRSLVSATTMWHNAAPHFVHPAVGEVWERLRSNLIDPTAPTYERIFVTRSESHPRRRCRNVRAVEQFFEAYGFTVIHPEALELGAQAAVFSAATVVAGFAGSAMFNLMFATEPKSVIMLSHEAYLGRNEHLYTSLIGGSVHYFWSSPDIPHPSGGWTRKASASSWEFDFDRNRAALENLLETMP
jgi:capsular polysaccharide biosynthesis protein